MHHAPLYALLLLCHHMAFSQYSGEGQPTAIHLNQLGYYPKAIKQAVIVDNNPSLSLKSFTLTRRSDQKILYRGTLSARENWTLAGESARVADFSSVNQPGEYFLTVPGLPPSPPFTIRRNCYKDALRTTIRGYYFQRASVALPEELAGQWYRPAGHTDREVVFHPSSGRKGRYASPGGWYDAGDFGKYTVNGGFALSQMLFLWEQYPQLLPDGDLRIPESGNGMSDFLDEMKVEMDWLLTMQDSDGGCFVKVTTPIFPPMIMPHNDTITRYVVGKSTAAALNFASAAAKMSRALRPVNPTYADTCLQAAKSAWQWAKQHPGQFFTNPKDIKTGEYGDGDMRQEFFQAAAELYVTTADSALLPELRLVDGAFVFREGSNWSEFGHFLGLMTLAGMQRDTSLRVQATRLLIKAADAILADMHGHDYLQPVDDFHWGSNSDVLGAAMICAHAFRTTRHPKYLRAVQQSADYIFGKNPFGISFVTGLGQHYPRHIHHRQSEADHLNEPVPGLLSGGPNSRKEDAALTSYPPLAPPMRCWTDDVQSYASNEVAINWNAPLVYVLGFLEAESK